MHRRIAAKYEILLRPSHAALNAAEFCRRFCIAIPEHVPITGTFDVGDRCSYSAAAQKNDNGIYDIEVGIYMTARSRVVVLTMRLQYGMALELT